MTSLGQAYRTYALDFWGFGESGKKRNSYTVQDFVSMVNQFMERMGIDNAPLVGHSMGGTVSLSLAIQHPTKTSKVVVVGSPIVGSSLALPLKFAGYKPIAYLLFNLMGAFRLGMRIASPSICRDPGFPEMMDSDLTKTTLESFLISIATLRRTDLRPYLDQIKIPTLGMFGDRDNIVDPRQYQVMQSGIPTARIERFKNAGHFIMLDEPEPFKQTLRNFLSAEASMPS